MEIHPFFDADTSTLTYVVHDEATRDAVVIDPVLDFDPASGSVRETSVQQVAAYLRDRGLRLRWVLETHAHADHLSGAQSLKRLFGVGLAIGEHIRVVQALFRGVFNLPGDFPVDGSQFDRLLTDGGVLEAGSLPIRSLHTPGHTPACMSYLPGADGRVVFTGDALFMPDYGVGRCDFPGGDATALYRSVQRLYTLPDETRVLVAHDYRPGGRELRWETTIGASKRENVQLSATTTEADFVAFRRARDATLAAPRLLYPSVRVNIDAGRLPPPAPNGRRYLEIPLRGPAVDALAST